MKIVKKLAAQGDVLFIRRDSVPTDLNLKEKSPEKNGGFVVAHSETGHNHVATGGDKFMSADDGMVSFLVTTQDIVVEHHRSWDTHEPLKLLNDGDGEVVWEIRRQREYTPEGWRRVED